jgi:hypothetical protein
MALPRARTAALDGMLRLLVLVPAQHAVLDTTAQSPYPACSVRLGATPRALLQQGASPVLWVSILTCWVPPIVLTAQLAPSPTRLPPLCAPRVLPAAMSLVYVPQRACNVWGGSTPIPLLLQAACRAQLASTPTPRGLLHVCTACLGATWKTDCP